MEPHQVFGYGGTGAGITYSSSYSSVPSIPNRLFGSLNFDSQNSPCSPFLNQFECDSGSSVSDNQEQRSCTNNTLGVSPSRNSSSPESTAFSNQLSPLVDHQPEGQRVLSCLPSGLQHVNPSQNMRHALQRLETVLMGHDDDVDATTSSTSVGESHKYQTTGQGTRGWSQDHQLTHVIQPQPSYLPMHSQHGEGLRVEERQKSLEVPTLQSFPADNLKKLLILCATALAENKVSDFDRLIEKTRGFVSISGEPIQRLGAYMIEGLVARKESSGSKIYHALRCTEPESNDLLSYMHILYEICPYMKFGYLAANGAIAEACRTEDRIHIIDFQIAQGTQWMTLLQALAARPGGAPHVCITGIDDPVSRYARGDGLDLVGKRLAAFSEKFNMPVEFHPVPVYALDVKPEMLDVRPGEALAVNFPLQLHHTPDESVDVNNPRDGLLRMVKSLNPKVTTLVEQESNTNTAPFLTRFVETLKYYSAIFESIDGTVPRDRKERIGVEQHCLARDIVNIIACEGKDRVERHELFGKWKSRFLMAGFRPYPLSSYVNSVIRHLLRCYSEHYTLEEKDGAMLLGWKDRKLISASAWH